MRHNDYPTTLLMELAANDEPSRYRMTPAASTVRHNGYDRSEARAKIAYEAVTIRFERGDHAPSMQWVGVDVAGGLGRSATVTYTRTGSTVRIDTVFTTPAPQLATTLPTEPEAEVWHTEAPTGPGVYIASSDRDPDFRRHWDGLVWSYAWREGDPEEVIAISRSLRHQAKTHIQWFRLIEADTPAPAAQESAKPAFAVGCRVVVLPHPDGGRHPSPFIALMNEDIGKNGTVGNITPSGNIQVRLDDRGVFIFPPSSLAIIQA